MSNFSLFETAYFKLRFEAPLGFLGIFLELPPVGGNVAPVVR